MSDAELMHRIHEIKLKSKGGGQMAVEYFKFMTHVRDHAPQRLLVWGLGFDSTLVDELNAGGKTLFLEPNVAWVKTSNAANLTYAAYDIRKLNTSVRTTAEFVKHPHRARIQQLHCCNTCWDTILVDSPLGLSSHDPSRAAPIYTAKVDVEACAANNTYANYATIFVHDCDRPGEDYLTRQLLGTHTTETGPKKLREWRIYSDKNRRSESI